MSVVPGLHQTAELAAFVYPSSWPCQSEIFFRPLRLANTSVLQVRNDE